VAIAAGTVAWFLGFYGWDRDGLKVSMGRSGIV
jgi:hypothetical protein